mgnify:CR=1 FL=1
MAIKESTNRYYEENGCLMYSIVWQGSVVGTGLSEEGEEGET